MGQVDSIFVQHQQKRFIDDLVERYQHTVDLYEYAALRAKEHPNYKKVGSTDQEFWARLRDDCRSQSQAYHHTIWSARRHLHLTIRIPSPSAGRGEQIYIREFVQEGA